MCTVSRWNPCKYAESDSTLMMCSMQELYYPKGAFDRYVKDIRDIKVGLTKGRYQEFLVNDETVFLVKGGSNWEIKFVCTLDEMRKSESEFGKKTLTRARGAEVPWHIAKLTRNISSDDEAIELLKQVKSTAQTAKLTKSQKYLLRGLDWEVRNIILRSVFEDIWNEIEQVVATDEGTSRHLAFYVVTDGKIVTSIDEKCTIPAAKPITVERLYSHNLNVRVIKAEVSRELAKLTDFIDDNDEAVELLIKIKQIARNTRVTSDLKGRLKNEDPEVCNSALKQILGKEIFSKIEGRIRVKSESSYYLAYYIIGASIRNF